MKKKPISFEEQISRLEFIVQQLDSGESTLEEMLVLYEEGMRLAKSCNEMLNVAEQKIITLQQGL